MWGEVKFWARRNWKLIGVGIGLVILTLVFIVVSRFSASDDSQMKKTVKEEEKIEQTIQEQESEIKGDSEFPEEVDAIPTEQDIVGFIKEMEEELGYDIEISSSEANELIEEEYGKGLIELVEEGYIVSKDMTAEQRNIMKMIQMSYYKDNGYIEREVELDEDGEEKPFSCLNTYVWFKENMLDTPLGIPKPKYHIRKYLQSNIDVRDYEYGVDVEDEEDGGSSTYTLFSLDKDFIENGYDISQKKELDKLTVKGGMVTKISREGFKGSMIYLIVQPNQTMTSEEFIEEYTNLEVMYDGKLVENKLSTEDFLATIPNFYRTQLVDVLYLYTEDDGYTGNESVDLTVNGESINLVLEGKEFTSKVK